MSTRESKASGDKGGRSPQTGPSGENHPSPQGDQLPANLQANNGKSANRKILVVGREPGFSGEIMDYAINLAERLGYDLIALNVYPETEAPGGFFSPYRKYLQEKFKRQARRQAEGWRQKLAAKGLHFEHLVKSGRLAKAVEALNAERKRIEFVISASEISESEVSAGMTLPVFTIKGYQGETLMAHDGLKDKKPVGKTIAFGLGAVALYAAVFLNGGTVMKYFTLGGWHAALPIATVFLFSYVHGSFSNYLWIALGIEPPKKTVQPRPATAARKPARRPRPRLTLNV